MLGRVLGRQATTGGAGVAVWRAQPWRGAGHSKWANIRHKKAANDAKRTQAFSKMAIAIISAVREKGADMSVNHRLAAMVAKAKSINMPKSRIEGAIQRAADPTQAATEQVEFEGTGPGGWAVIVDCLTDQRNRTVAQVRHLFRKHNGSLGTPGSAAFNFETVGLVELDVHPGESADAEAVSETLDQIMELALEAGASDVEWENAELETEGAVPVWVVSPPSEFDTVHSALRAIAQGPDDEAASTQLPCRVTIEGAEVTRRALSKVELDGDAKQAFEALLDEFHDQDDVQTVYHNVEL